MEDGKLKQLKKRLFIMGAYLAVLGALLIYVSFSAYKIKIKAQAIMPEALGFQARITLDPGSITNSAIVSNNMSHIGPGDTLSYDESKHNFFSVKVDNYAYIGTAETTNEAISQMPITYKLKLITLGALPLNIKVSECGIIYDAVSVAGVQNTFTFKHNGQDLILTLPAFTKEERETKFYVGWQSFAENRSSQTSKYINELEVFRVEAEIIPNAQDETSPHVGEYNIITYIPTTGAVSSPGITSP